jgi:hypothetical protein
MPKYGLKYAPKARICSKFALKKTKISTNKPFILPSKHFTNHI